MEAQLAAGRQRYLCNTVVQAIRQASVDYDSNGEKAASDFTLMFRLRIAIGKTT